METPEFSIMVPTYQEAEGVSGYLDNLVSLCQETNKTFEILVVDDDSPDGTADIVSDYSKKCSEVRVVVRKFSKGLAPAALYGYQFTNAPISICCDADGSHDLSLLPEILEAFKLDSELDIVLPSRYMPGGGLDPSWPVKRVFMSKFAKIFCYGLTRATDPLSGYYAIRMSALKGARLEPIGFKQLLEILARVKIRKSLEIPYVFKDRAVGYSKASLNVIFLYGLHLMALYFDKFTGKLKR